MFTNGTPFGFEVFSFNRLPEKASSKKALAAMDGATRLRYLIVFIVLIFLFQCMLQSFNQCRFTEIISAFAFISSHIFRSAKNHLVNLAALCEIAA
jgi:hypothetical protein